VERRADLLFLPPHFATFCTKFSCHGLTLQLCFILRCCWCGSSSDSSSSSWCGMRLAWAPVLCRHGRPRSAAHHAMHRCAPGWSTRWPPSKSTCNCCTRRLWWRRRRAQPRCGSLGLRGRRRRGRLGCMRRKSASCRRAWGRTRGCCR